jgi:hypothetical protein
MLEKAAGVIIRSEGVTLQERKEFMTVWQKWVAMEE